MRICVLGKYPPIEGGVSAQTYWMTRGLAERGHQIHVVTNADEVEETYRLTLGPGDSGWYQPEFEKTGGCVRVYNAQPFSPRAMGHIPAGNPFVSKLASLATDVVRRHQCEAILAYYYEPYGVAGWMASRWTGCPFIIKHAGSDLDRLFRVMDLATTYKEILRSADAVVTQPFLMPRFVGLGIDRRRLEPDIPYSLPADVFSPSAEPLNLERAAISLDRAEDEPRVGASGGRTPVIGVFGKIGVAKGTYDLIKSLGHLAREGLDFRLAAMIGRAQSQILAPALRKAGLEERMYMLPMLPNWRVPEFLRACTAVCFLERDFPVAIHGPIIPREILACGACLILSGEIAAKQRYRDRLISGENVVIVNDPRDHAELAAALRLAVTNPMQMSSIGEQGFQISRSLENFPAFVSGWEDLLGRYTSGAMSRQTDVPRGAGDTSSVTDFAWLLPDLVSFLRRNCGPLVDRFVPSAAASNPFETAIAFCDFIAEALDGEVRGAEIPKLRTVLAYAKERLVIGHDSRECDEPTFPVCDHLQGATVSIESASQLKPVRGNAVRIVPFEYDISDLGILSSVGGYAATGDDNVDFTAIEAAPLLVLFHKSANLIPCVLRIDDATRELVERCDGSRTTNELIDEMCQRFGVGAPSMREELGHRICGALDHLYQSGVLVFGEYREGWGWTGGSRGSGESVAQAHLAAGQVTTSVGL